MDKLEQTIRSSRKSRSLKRFIKTNTSHLGSMRSGNENSTHSLNPSNTVIRLWLNILKCIMVITIHNRPTKTKWKIKKNGQEKQYHITKLKLPDPFVLLIHNFTTRNDFLDPFIVKIFIDGVRDVNKLNLKIKITDNEFFQNILTLLIVVPQLSKWKNII